MDKASTRGGFWTVPRFLEGQTVAIVATGPSLSDEQLELCRDSDVSCLAVNNGYEYAPWSIACYAADRSWWKAYWEKGREGGSGVKDFQGLKITTEDPIDPSVFRIENNGVDGFDPDPGKVRTGKNSAYQAAHIAAHAGADTIILLGCDCKPGTQGEAHKFGDHVASTKRTGGDGYPPFDKFLKHWPTILPGLTERGIRIVNCSPGSAIECFEKRDLQGFLNEIGAGRPAKKLA